MTCPGMLHQVHFIKGLISQKCTDLHPLTIIIHVSYGKMQSIALTGMAPGAVLINASPIYFIIGLIPGIPWNQTSDVHRGFTLIMLNADII